MGRIGRHDDELEARLRARRSEPREDFLAALVSRASAGRSRPRFGRALVAVGVTALLLAAVAAAGGIDRSASPLSTFAAPVHVLKKLTHPHHDSGPGDAREGSHPDADSHHDADVDRPHFDKHDLRDLIDKLTSGAGQYGFVVCIRPPGHPEDQHTIRVGSIWAVIALIRHGAYLGPCRHPYR